MVIDLAPLGYTFEQAPLLIGGQAMEHYGLRPAGDDADFIVALVDFERLARRYPGHGKELEGDRGLLVGALEFWASFRGYDYAFLAADAVPAAGYGVIAPEKLLFLKALCLDRPKDERDARLLARALAERRLPVHWRGHTGADQGGMGSITD
jgi:hypothetical protein